VVAALEDNAAWMVSDAAITGGKLGLRDREYTPKIFVGTHFAGLVGFAEGAEYGADAGLRAANMPNADDALAALVAESASANVEFLFTHMVSSDARLWKIARGKAVKHQTAHIGNTEAFGAFQRIRHARVGAHAPLALKNFIVGTELQSRVPASLASATRAMLDLFASRSERDVGGWAIPYLLTAEGVGFCSYAHGVSDPTFDELVPGSIVQHGSAERGGWTLSVTGLPDRSGMIVYWLQPRSGLVFRRTEMGYEQRRFGGSPSEFREKVRKAYSLEAELFIGDQPTGPPQVFHMLRGKDGALNAVIADHGGPLSIAVHNLAEQFEFGVTLPVNQEWEPTLPTEMKLTLVSEEAVELRLRGEAVSLTVAEVENTILAFAKCRAGMKPEVPVIPEPGSKVTQMCIRDPAWRTQADIHPDAKGALLSLRHIGLGWLGFILPIKESLSLGKWLVSYAKDNGAESEGESL
jgi:hypothetical protein